MLILVSDGESQAALGMTRCNWRVTGGFPDKRRYIKLFLRWQRQGDAESNHNDWSRLVGSGRFISNLGLRGGTSPTSEGIGNAPSSAEEGYDDHLASDHALARKAEMQELDRRCGVGGP